MKDLLNKIQTEIETFNIDAKSQVESGNKAAGTRARKASLNVEKLMKEFRKASLTESNK
ncbi:histone H1 [Sinomicrobium pectinilyticum]|uniref:Histone H1 n=1 Tax=Sinomicrobium pectinilyticum TaxID=1084421 RepID=A0A3N0EKX2_SINP1|nr:histone H1 [Sinomicrobium pectinilyticum]RNL88528.1 histone H1 [Sinomicrobium pectinilyticum]